VRWNTDSNSGTIQARGADRDSATLPLARCIPSLGLPTFFLGYPVDVSAIPSGKVRVTLRKSLGYPVENWGCLPILAAAKSELPGT
jgi:hypothetical protein